MRSKRQTARLRLLAGALIASALALPSALQAQEYKWNNIFDGAFVNGDWDLAGNWTPSGPPENNGTADIVFEMDLATGALTTGVNLGSWSINSLSLVGRTLGSNSNVLLVAGPLSGGSPQYNGQAANLIIGAGGLSNATNLNANGNTFEIGTSSPLNVLTLTLAEDQNWSITRVSGDSNNSGRITFNANLAGDGNLTKTGNGQLRFAAGSSAAYTGTVTLAGGEILLAINQLGRLGPNALQWQNAGGTTLGFNNIADNNAYDFQQDIAFSDTGAGFYNLSLPTGISAAISNASIAFSGEMSGVLNETLLISSPSVAAGKNGFHYRISGNNSGLSSSIVGNYSFNQAGVNIRTGHVVLDNANALGTGNSISISVGQHNAVNNTGDNAGIHATDGSHVSANIYALVNTRTDQPTTRSSETTLGLHGTGAVTFSGQIGIGTTNNAAHRVNPLFLSAGADGTVTFSGQIVNGLSSDAYKPAVIATGGGTVVMSNANNTYGGTGTAAGFGGTNVTDGTTLLVNGGTLNATSSGTGTGRVLVGYSAGSAEVSTTSDSGLVTVTGGTSGLIIGQTITGAGIAAGSIITTISSNGTDIEISKRATATGTATATLVGSTGTLGGVGRIRPNEANGIVVASGSVVAPGPLAGIGDLTLDGGATTGALLTMNTGSTFAFALGAGNASSELAFWNFQSGDLVLNDNTLNFTGAEVGTYTLFTFYGDSGITPIASGISDGLVLGSGLDGFTAELNYNPNSITLTVIPEPGTIWLMVGGLLCSIVFARRRRS